MEYTYTQDWVRFRVKDWMNYLLSFKDKPDIIMLEIGCFEGRSSIWFLENILTSETSSMICIDPYFQPVFFKNILPFRHKVRAVKDFSQKVLRDSFYFENKFDIVYIDGNHRASAVLEDAVLSFRTLKQNGIMIFDDYLWKSSNELSEPKLGIDSFLQCYEGQFKVLHKEYQLIIRKISISL